MLIRPGSAIDRQTPIQGEPSAISERARQQHDSLAVRLAARGIRTVVADGAADSPLSAFIADAAVMFVDGAILMRPSDMTQRRDVAAVEAMLSELRVPIIGRIEPPGLLDGGDVIVGPDAAYVGVSSARAAAVGIAAAGRSNAHGRAQFAGLARAAGKRPVDVPMAADVRRLRSVAALVDDDTVVFAPAVVAAEPFAKLQRIEVPSGEDYGAGVLALGARNVIANLRFRTVLPLLRKAKIDVEALDLWEFGKLGAGPSMLVLALRRG